MIQDLLLFKNSGLFSEPRLRASARVPNLRHFFYYDAEKRFILGVAVRHRFSWLV